MELPVPSCGTISSMAWNSQRGGGKGAETGAPIFRFIMIGKGIHVQTTWKICTPPDRRRRQTAPPPPFPPTRRPAQRTVKSGVFFRQFPSFFVIVTHCPLQNYNFFDLKSESRILIAKSARRHLPPELQSDSERQGL